MDQIHKKDNIQNIILTLTVYKNSIVDIEIRIKLELLHRHGGTLITVPFWWDGSEKR